MRRNTVFAFALEPEEIDAQLLGARSEAASPRATNAEIRIGVGPPIRASYQPTF